MRQIPLRLDDELFDRVEEARGDVPRERWIRRAIEDFLSSNVETMEGKNERRKDRPRDG